MQKICFVFFLQPSLSSSRGYAARDTHRNELHLQSHEQHRLTKAERVELNPSTQSPLDNMEKDTYVYEVNIPDLRPHRFEFLLRSSIY